MYMPYVNIQSKAKTLSAVAMASWLEAFPVPLDSRFPDTVYAIG